MLKTSDSSDSDTDTNTIQPVNTIGDVQELTEILQNNLELEEDIPPLLLTNELSELQHAPIFLADNGYMLEQKNKDNFKELLENSQNWIQYSGITNDEIQTQWRKYIQFVKELPKPPKFDQLLIRDSERTFIEPYQRTTLLYVLTFLKDIIFSGDYNQGMSIVIGFLWIVLPLKKVLALCYKANTNPFYIPEVWKIQSVTGATDGYIVETLLQQKYPELLQHCKSIGLLPEQYIYKVWCALGIHVLPFSILLSLLNSFWLLGAKGLFLWQIKIFYLQNDIILQTKNIQEILQYLRLDPNVVSYNKSIEIFNDISYDNDILDSIDKYIPNTEQLIKIRSEHYDKYLRARVETVQAPTVDTTPDCQNSSCEESKHQGFYFCIDCKLHLCETCAYSIQGTHDDNIHEVCPNEELE